MMRMRATAVDDVYCIHPAPDMAQRETLVVQGSPKLDDALQKAELGRSREQ